MGGKSVNISLKGQLGIEIIHKQIIYQPHFI